MIAPILHPGDIVHLAVPNSDRFSKEQQAEQLMAVYRTLGITISIVSTIESPAMAGPYVVSVIRAPKPSLRKRDDGLWEEI